MTRRVISAAFAALLVNGAFAVTSYGATSEDSIRREVRHALITLPYYGVFDNLDYRVNGSEVTLMGQVVNPVTPDDAANAVKQVPGVTKVINKIELLPVSPMDWGIRRAVYRAIYGDPALQRYAFQAVPSIHIIVKNGSVTLVGAVATQMDKEVAGVRANSVPGIFAVTNNLMLDSQIQNLGKGQL